jgi:multisubunit Na+/H+ antiporter MnhB subunit
MWLSTILVIPIARLLMPLSKLRELQSTFIVLDEEKITQLRMDETEQEEIPYQEIDAITLNQAAYWKKPLPRGAWLRITAPHDKEIRVNQGWNPAFQNLVSKIKVHLADYDITWIYQTRSYLRDVRYYILAALYFGTLIFGTTVFTETVFSPEGSSRENITILITLLPLLLLFQFAPDLERVFRSRTRNRILLTLIGSAILLFGCYLAWQNTPAIGVIALVLGFGLVVQILLWIIRLFEWLLSKIRV